MAGSKPLIFPAATGDNDLAQHRRYSAFIQDRENLLDDGNTLAAREGPEWR